VTLSVTMRRGKSAASGAIGASQLGQPVSYG